LEDPTKKKSSTLGEAAGRPTQMGDSTQVGFDGLRASHRKKIKTKVPFQKNRRKTLAREFSGWGAQASEKTVLAGKPHGHRGAKER